MTERTRGERRVENASRIMEAMAIAAGEASAAAWGVDLDEPNDAETLGGRGQLEVRVELAGAVMSMLGEILARFTPPELEDAMRFWTEQRTMQVAARANDINIARTR